MNPVTLVAADDISVSARSDLGNMGGYPSFLAGLIGTSFGIIRAPLIFFLKNAEVSHDPRMLA